jgi:muramoyltetrapeptide carboxypeptidase
MFSDRTKTFVPLNPIPKGATFGITAPATTPDPEKLNRGIEYLESCGYQVKVGETCHREEFYVAGPDEIRAYELMDMVEDPQVDAIICARGGYGSMRLIKLLDFQLFYEQRKPLIGFSDITALQWALYAQTGLPSLSAGMVATDMAREPFNDQWEEAYWKFLETGTVDYQLEHQQEDELTIQGLGLAGTSSVALKLLGSSYFPDPKDHILILEDVNEQTHKIEAYLLQFALAGLFDRAAAVITGIIRKAEEEEYPKVPDLDTVLDRAFQSTRTPVVPNLPYGHIDNKIPLPIGAPLSLSLGPQSTLKSTESIFKS